MRQDAAEHILRRVAVGHMNLLLPGSGEAGKRDATLMSVVGTCKFQGVDPEARLPDVLVRVATTPVSRIAELTPCVWTQARQGRPRRFDARTVGGVDAARRCASLQRPT